MVVGYARVSTPEQKLEAQIDLLKNAGCEKIYKDIASGTRDDRKGLNEMLRYMRKGDTILTYKNDRVFRSLKNMVELIDRFNEAGVHFKSLSEPEFDTTSANGKFLLQIFAAVAEFERNLISERTKVGLDNARKRNKLLGRPKGSKIETIEKYHYAKHLYGNQGVSIDLACKRAKIGKTSFYRVEKELSSKSSS
ncbi:MULTISPECIES: recombinase family protein [Flavobacteriaceae]|jgi:DNA invertase Pin-like site-specific DNA recombinase|uniref:DNA-invertase n=2 Tax=Maribacter cobaltidurans TaxID=1178778 RepID=A0A223VA47_9FLAO|nr:MULTISPECIES: recombinase family protein [Flavobacteriaceae]GMN12201.1 recombinase family protein [Croceitalea sp. MTPC6]GMN18542.1 recombinase family protein [Croceitalea sp. MTPC9]ASV32097.1 DNA-invertase [Maribacter cobaltidurans]ASV32263.1 DNA-invertase [Maribacter cobaltidurans]MCK0193013.1 recombinase family protein [Arenibacter sp. F20364]|tara:strand:- start:6 stop:587 length:582 start_codon:yes stop_codon:yes gene_type:complete